MKFRWPLMVGAASRGDEEDLRALSERIVEASEVFAVPGDAAARARSRMNAAISRGEAARPRAWGAGGLGLGGRRPGRVAAAAILVAIVIAGSAAYGLIAGGNGPAGVLRTGSAEAVVLNGTLKGQTRDGLLLSTGQGTEVVALGPDQVVLDAVGNPIPLDSLTPGQSLSVKGKRDERSAIVVEEIHATTEVRGRVQAVSDGRLELAGERVAFSVVLTPSTETRGLVRIGSLVEVEVGRDANNNLVALRVKTEEGGEDTGGRPEPTPSVAPALAPSRQDEHAGQGPETTRTPEAQEREQPIASAASPTAEPRRAEPTATRESERDDDYPATMPQVSPPTPPPPPPPPPPPSSGGGSDDEHESEPEH